MNAAPFGRQAVSQLQAVLRAAPDTRILRIDAGVRHEAGEVFASLFHLRPALVVADENTLWAAGFDVQASFTRSGRAASKPFVFEQGVWAESSFVERLCDRLRQAKETVPVAVGSGTINDLTKLAAHRLRRPYMVVATAASMDGYTSYGASITHQASKQTFNCRAPRAVLADLEVIARAPEGMNAAGYADLLAKNVAGADWILADAAGVEPIDNACWDAVHRFLPLWVGSPRAIAQNELESLRRLVNGLMMSGFAMQMLRSSRPASGAEHQFSHLWDMQHHRERREAPSHGFKVGIGMLASLALYEDLLARDVERLDVERAVRAWPSLEKLDRRVARLFGAGELAETARVEARAKHLSASALRRQLVRLREGWPDLRERLKRHLIPLNEARRMLREAGCPCEPVQIGISRERLRLSYRQAYHIRRRFTVLDLAFRMGLAGAVLKRLFGPTGPWPAERGGSCIEG